MMRKPEFAFWAFVVMAALCGLTTMFNVSRAYTAAPTDRDFYARLDLFGDVIERVRADYVEKPDDALLIENAINGMLTGLDPHSAYLNPKHFRDMQVTTRGEFGGLGIEVTMEQGLVKVVSPIDDTPAAKAGLLAGDLISHIDNEQIQGLTLEQAVEKMRGLVGTTITITVVRRGRDDPFDVKITRDRIVINPVKSRLEDDVIYVKISTFSEQTSASLNRQVNDLKAQVGKKLKGYVIDLRNNPGGLLDQSILVSDAFLEKGPIVFTKGRNLEEMQRANAKPGDITDGKKIVVLINGGSASASEIVAGALQDHKRAVIMGTRSFGKGSVQTIIPLGANGALRLTTARYFTPSNRSIQAKGIVPDLVIEQELPDDLKGKQTEKQRGEATLRGHLKGDGKEEASPVLSSYVPREKEKDTQLLAALAFVRDDSKTIESLPVAKAPTPEATPPMPEKKPN